MNPSFLDPAANGQRDQITAALMNIAMPPPQMPMGGQPGMAPPGDPTAQAAPVQPGAPQGDPMQQQQQPQQPPPPMMAGALGGVMQPQPQQPQMQPQQQQMPPQGM